MIWRSDKRAVPLESYDDFLDYLCRQIPAIRSGEDILIVVTRPRIGSVQIPVRSAALHLLYEDVLRRNGKARKTAMREAQVALSVEAAYVAQRSDRFEISDW
jgi:hypothetical protein